MGYFKKIVIGALLLSTVGVLPNPIHNLNVDEQKSVMDTTPTESPQECSLHTTPAPLLAKVIDCKITANCITALTLSSSILDTASTGTLQGRTLRVNFTLPLGTCGGFKINAPNTTTVLALPICIFNASIVDSLQDCTLHVLLTASKVVVNISITERLQERTLRLNFTLPLADYEGFDSTVPSTIILALPESIVKAAIIDSFQACTFNLLSTASKAVASISTTKRLQERTSRHTFTLLLADYEGFDSTVPSTIILALPESIVKAAIMNSSQDCTFNLLSTASKAVVNISTTERLQEHTLHLTFKVSLADYEGFNSTVPSTIILALPESIVKAAINHSSQDCTFDLLPTASKAVVNISTTERLQEHTLRLTFTLPLADYEGFNSTVSRTIILALPESIVNAAITESLQECTLQKVLTLPLADFDNSKTNVPHTAILMLLESIVNTDNTESLKERTLQEVLTLPLADFVNSKTNETYTAILMLPKSIVNTDYTESLKECTLDAIPTGLLVIVDATTTKKLKERVFTLTLTVSLANQDLATSSLETSGNALMAENSLPEKRSPPKSGSLSGVRSASGKRSLSDNRSPSESAHPSASDHRSPVYGRIIYFIVQVIASFIIAGMMGKSYSIFDQIHAYTPQPLD